MAFKVDNSNTPRLILQHLVTKEKYHLLGKVPELNKVMLLRLSDNVKIIKSWKNVVEQLEKVGYYD